MASRPLRHIGCTLMTASGPPCRPGSTLATASEPCCRSGSMVVTPFGPLRQTGTTLATASAPSRRIGNTLVTASGPLRHIGAGQLLRFSTGNRDFSVLKTPSFIMATLLPVSRRRSLPPPQRGGHHSARRWPVLRPTPGSRSRNKSYPEWGCIAAASRSSAPTHAPKSAAPASPFAQCKVEVIKHRDRPVYGTQFHPEIYDDAHPHGKILLQNLFRIADTCCSRK